MKRNYCKLALIFAGGAFAAVTIGCRDDDQRSKAETATPLSVKGIIQLDESKREELGIEVAPVKSVTERHRMPSVGWFVAPPAAEVTVKVPVAGLILPPAKGEWAKLGQEIGQDQSIAQLNVFLSPQEVSQLVQAKEDNDIQIQQSLVTMELTESQLKAASNARDAVTGVRIDQLKEAYERAKVAYKEAQDKIPFLIQEPYESGALIKPITIASPKCGRILQVHVSPGQFVQSGEPLWSVGDWSTLWLRVPVFDSDVNRIVPNELATVRDHSSSDSILAAPIEIPTETKAAARTVDRYFSVPNPNWKFRVGQSITVELPLSGVESLLTIPRSAILYDGFGQPFCYAAEEDSSNFQRRRLELGATYQNAVSVKKGLDTDDIVVSVGAEQLAAEEFKSDLSMEDDD